MCSVVTRVIARYTAAVVSCISHVKRFTELTALTQDKLNKVVSQTFRSSCCNSCICRYERSSQICTLEEHFLKRPYHCDDSAKAKTVIKVNLANRVTIPKVLCDKQVTYNYHCANAYHIDFPILALCMKSVMMDLVKRPSLPWVSYSSLVEFSKY